jgi:threonine dehydrogenase-like Zn-dependent dehydrogenase
VVDEIQLIGSRCGPFEPAIEMLARKEIDPTVLISRRFPVEAGLDAFNCAAKTGALKVLIDMET